MEVRMDGTSGKVVVGIDPVLAEIHRRLQADPKKWLKTLEQTPGGLANLEQEIHRAFSQMADRVVAGGRDRAAEGANSIKRTVLRRNCMIPFGE